MPQLQRQEPRLQVKISGIEVWARIVTVCEGLALLEEWRNKHAAERNAIFQAIVRALAAHFDLDAKLRALMPHEELFETAVEDRMVHNRSFFKDVYIRLLVGRDAALPWLLMTTYRDHPPTAVEALRFLRLDDIRVLLDGIAAVLKTDAVSAPHINLVSTFIYEQNEKLRFLIEQLPQYGIHARTYAGAVEQYVNLLNSIFPQCAETTRPGDVVAELQSLDTGAA